MGIKNFELPNGINDYRKPARKSAKQGSSHVDGCRCIWMGAFLWITSRTSADPDSSLLFHCKAFITRTLEMSRGLYTSVLGNYCSYELIKR